MWKALSSGTGKAGIFQAERAGPGRGRPAFFFTGKKVYAMIFLYIYITPGGQAPGAGDHKLKRV